MQLKSAVFVIGSELRGIIALSLDT